MSTRAPIAIPIPGLLVLAALAIAAATSLSFGSGQLPKHALGGHPTTITRQGQSESHSRAGALNQVQLTEETTAPISGEPSGGVPQEGSPGIGIQRFADAEPGTLGLEARQAVPNCLPKRCPRPQR